MGWTWEVSAWREVRPGKYAYEDVYCGNSAWRALRAAGRAKRSSGCVKVEWR